MKNQFKVNRASGSRIDRELMSALKSACDVDGDNRSEMDSGLSVSGIMDYIEGERERERERGGDGARRKCQQASP